MLQKKEGRTLIVNQGIETLDMWFNQFLESCNIRSIGRWVSKCPFSSEGSEGGMILRRGCQ